MADSNPPPIHAAPRAHARHWPAAALLAIFVLVAVWLSLSVPIFEGPDENEHFEYMRIIAHERRLPAYSFSVPPEQKIQPPLYYAAGALLAGWVPLDDLDRYLVHNPHASISRVETPGNKNAFVHAREEGGWGGTALAVHLFRWLSVALGAGTVLATYLLALAAFKGHRWPALGAMALVAFNPQFVYLSALINTDNAVTALSTTGLLLSVYVLERSPSLRPVIWLGLVAGLAGLAKITGLGVLGIGLLAVALAAWRARSLRYWLLASAILVAVALLVGGWWYARNWWLYGDPFLAGLLRYHYDNRPELLTLGDWLLPYLQAEVSYWAVFGWLNIAVPEGFYRAFGLFSRVGLAGLLWFAARWLRRRPPPVRTEVVGLLLIWAALILGGLVNYVSIFGGLQGRHYFPMIASLAILLVLGWIALLPPRAWPWFGGGLAAALLVVAVALPARYVLPRYVPPPALTADQIPPAARQPPRYFGEAIALLGAEVEPGPVVAGGRARVTLYWQALEPVEANYSVFVHLLGREGQVAGQSNSYPAQGLLATSLWRPGEVIVDRHEVAVDPAAAAPTLARVDVGLFRFEAPGQPGPAPLDAAGRPVSSVVGLTKIAPATQSGPAVEPSIPLDVRFEDGIVLQGVDRRCDLHGTACELTLYWRPAARPSADYTVFIQLWDDERQVAGFDGPPLGGDYPTGWWDAGETIVDRRALTPPADLPAGKYRWLLGLYRPETGARLPAFAAGGAPLPDFAVELEQPASGR